MPKTKRKKLPLRFNKNPYIWLFYSLIVGMCMFLGLGLADTAPVKGLAAGMGLFVILHDFTISRNIYANITGHFVLENNGIGSSGLSLDPLNYYRGDAPPKGYGLKKANFFDWLIVSGASMGIFAAFLYILGKM